MTEFEDALSGDAMHHVNLLHLFELLFAGLLAGFEIAVHYGIAAPSEALGEVAQIVLRQAMILRLRVLAPAIFLPTFFLALLVTVQERHAPGLWMRAVGLVALLLWIVIRILRTVRVNSATLEWNPEAPPADWRSLIRETERFHVVAAWAAVISFICFLMSALSYR